jgi:hypothetical protein
MPGRQIDDNILLVQALFDDPDAEGLAVFADWIKAYDRVDHPFLLAVVRHLGFGDVFIQRVALGLADRNAVVVVTGFASDLCRISVLRSLEEINHALGFR